ncbi:hypothetical protein ACTJKQ_13205 [Acidovorax sp. 22279]|uniref:hypothetical protein n=1 Tax=Acidovorax sp. 22279 TaxID=3453900 RepID=UPI003F84EF00
MDHFGIGAAIYGAARVYFQSARRTGRTTALLDGLKDGDRVCCATGDEARHLERQCRERGLQVQVFTLPPNQAFQVFDRGTPQGRTIFDHGWVELYYLAALENARAELDHLQRQASGFGAAHFETRAKARELANWGFPSDTTKKGAR